MKIKFSALLAVPALCCLNAASIPLESQAPLKPPLAIYYSFDTPPPAFLFAEMESEMDRILSPANLRVTWRSTDTRNRGTEDFPGIVVFRFHGRCSFKTDSAEAESAPDPGGLALAETQIMDGHVLPFGEVNCDRLRHFIEPAAKSLDVQTRNSALGRAMARVSAHEIYHMLTESEIHASKGIARPAHSRAELTAQTFSFARPETDWLRAWAERQTKTVSDPEEEEIDPEPATLAGR